MSRFEWNLMELFFMVLLILQKLVFNWGINFRHLVPREKKRRIRGAVHHSFYAMNNITSIDEKKQQILGIVSEHFPQLHIFLPVIDRDIVHFDGLDERVEPTIKFKALLQERGSIYCLALDQKTSGEPENNSSILLINGKYTPDFERILNYSHARCRFYTPGSHTRGQIRNHQTYLHTL
jgi:hypothetical protein